jgi:5-(carboxyamino)imidazole ribonucleotide synthase
VLKKVGLLGGGQLARMLALTSHQLGHIPYVFACSLKEPAAQVCPETQIEPLMDRPSLIRFFEKVDVVTVESEFFDADLLAEAEKATKTPCYPSPKILGILQDRLTQKEYLLASGLPTLPHIAINTPADLQAAHTQFGKHLVLKARRLGYDGYGTYIARKGAHSPALKNALKTNSSGFIAEPFFPFKRELALLVARSTDGTTCNYPWVETYQENSRCLWVKGPVSPAKSNTVVEKIKRFLKDIGYVGVIAFEFFESKRGELFINEVHNSGHITMDAMTAGQFQTHLECILGHKLSDPEPLADGFAMYNLLGEGTKNVKLPSVKGVRAHWYGKSESRKGRKMGHLNALAASPEIALRKVKRARKEFKV